MWDRRPRLSRLLPRAASSSWLLGAALFAQQPEMARIPGGDCPIGASVSHEAVHKPKVDEFWIALLPVTNEDYKRFIDDTGHAAPESNSMSSKFRLWEGTSFPAGIARQPVVNVSWQDAVAYCRWLSKKTGKNFRLPTEEEWEVAARGGLAKKPYPWGDGIDKKMAWYGQKWNGARTLEEAGYGKANGYGLLGMAGNVWQWTADWYVPTFNGRPVVEELQLYKVIRGGSWVNEQDFLTVNYRNFHPPDFRDVFLGFRVASSVP